MICKTILVLDSGLEFEAVPIQDALLADKVCSVPDCGGLCDSTPRLSGESQHSVVHEEKRV